MHCAARTLIAALLLATWAGRPAAAAPPYTAQSDAALVRTDHARIRYELLTLGRGAAKVHRFAIPLAHVELSYLDLAYQTPLVEALGSHDLVLNGGYWGYREQTRVIEGLLIVNDQRLAPAHRRGAVLEVRNGRARVVHGEGFRPAAHTALALQCHPRLVDAGKLIPKLEAGQRAPRTALCVGADRAQLEAYLTEDPITLPELAAFLRAQGCREALNLDGGASTAAVARLPEGRVTIGRGAALPYGIAFRIVASAQSTRERL